MINVSLHEIPGYKNFTSIEPILEGGSGEDKYCVTTAKGERMFLRVGICNESYKNHEMHMWAEALDITIARTISVGLFRDNRYYYYWLQTWIDGVNAMNEISSLHPSGQYALGVKTGKLLKKIHSLPLMEEPKSLYDRIEKGIQFAVEERHKKYKHSTKLFANVLSYVNDNKHVLLERGQTFMHGDFGLSNLLITPAGEVAPTDFHYNMRSYGDPYSEISSFSERGATTPYMSGQIFGYFDGIIQNDFWQAYLFYEAYVALMILATRETQEWGRFIDQWYKERIINESALVPSWYIH